MIGSTWKKWDLHVHSPATYGGEYKDFISNLEKSEDEIKSREISMGKVDKIRKRK